MNQDELYHYGVLGMKWGTHRAKVNAMKAIKARKAGNMALAKKRQARSDYLRTKHTTRGGGKKVYDKVSNTSTGKLLLESIPLGTYGALNYNRLRAHGKSRALSAGGGVATRIGSNMVGMLPSIVEPRLTSYDISDRNKNKKYMDIRKAKRDYKQAKLEYKQSKKANKEKIKNAKSEMKDAKKTYKQENKQFKKDFTKASSIINTARSMSSSKAKRAKAEHLYDKSSASARKANSAEQRYKKAKKRYKQMKQNVYA